MIDSGCTNHMTGERSIFSTLQKNDSPSENIIFGDDGKGKVIGLGKVAISNDYSLSNILLVESLNYNLLSLKEMIPQ